MRKFLNRLHQGGARMLADCWIGRIDSVGRKVELDGEFVEQVRNCVSRFNQVGLSHRDKYVDPSRKLVNAMKFPASVVDRNAHRINQFLQVFAGAVTVIACDSFCDGQSIGSCAIGDFRQRVLKNVSPARGELAGSARNEPTILKEVEQLGSSQL